MKMGMNVTGLDELAIKLSNIAEKVPANARKVMHRESDKIVKMAQLYAPVDKHNLEQAIHKEVGYEGRGRLTISIVAGGIVNGVNVDQYAAEIHENYEGMKPGKGTLAKQAENPGVRVGGKFLDRAVADSKPKLEKAMIQQVERDMKELEE